MIADDSASAGRLGAGGWRLQVAAAFGAGVVLALVLMVLAPAAVVLPVAATTTDFDGLVLSGVHGVEENYGHRIRWTTGRARARWAGQFGIEPAALVVSLAGFPGRQPDQLQLVVDRRVTRHAVPADYGDVRVALPPTTRSPLDIAIVTMTTRPPGDPRDLGVRLEAITIENQPIGARLRGLARGDAVVVMLFGALAWLAGGWLAGRHATAGRRTASAAAVWGGAVVVSWAALTSALNAGTWPVLPAAVFGVVTAVMLTRAGHDRRVAGATAVVVAIQALVTITWFSSAFVDVPRWDIWEMVPMLVRRDQHGLSLADFWAPHNEHRPTVSRVVLMANIVLTRWNHWNELWVMLLVVAAHVLVYVRVIGRMAPARGWATAVAVAGAGTFVATATQWENFLQGWQIALVVGAMAMSAALTLIAGPAVSWPRLAGAASLVLLGTASFASCLLGWPLGAVAMAIRRPPSWRAKCVVWLAIGVSVGVAYMHGLERPVGLPPPAAILSDVTALRQVLRATLLALAMPVWYAPMPTPDPTSTAWWLLPTIGGIAVATGAALVLAHLRHREAWRNPVWLLPALLMLFAVAACGMAAVGRVPLGIHALTASRYIAFTGLFWVGLVLLLTVSSPWRGELARRSGVAVALLVVALGLRAWSASLPYIEEHFVSGSLARDALLREDFSGTLALFPVPPVLDERRQYLREQGLSLYRPGAQ